MKDLRVAHQLAFELDNAGAFKPSHRDLREMVDNAFEGFIGNSAAVHALKRTLLNALAQTPPRLNKNLLMVGPASSGKTELARRVAAAMGLPFVQTDGRNLRDRETLVELVDAALRDFGRKARPTAARSGIPVMDYPPFIVFVDEAHLLPSRVQEGLLTLLEMDDRSMMVGGKDDRMIIRAYQSGFILATTKPSLMDKPLRSRCTDVPLARYNADEVAQMLGGRFPHLPEHTRKEIAVCARVIPRRAFEIAREIDEEREYQGTFALERGHVLSVLRGRGVVAANGITAEDVNYLKLLNKANRPLGERMAVSALGFADTDRLVEDIEPFLIYDLGYVRKVPAGREITERGRAFLNKYREEEEKRNDSSNHQAASAT